MLIKYLTVLSMLLTAGVASADTIALTSNRTIGNQGYPGALGMDFDVLSAITVTQLGAFDSGQDGFAGTIRVGIFNRNTGSLIGTSATFSGSGSPLVGNSRFIDLLDFTLQPGQYSIVAVGFSNADLNGNLLYGGPVSTIDTAANSISFVGRSRYTSSTSLILPGIIDGGSVNQYDAGTFQFTTAVPEPSTRAVLLAGIGLGIALFRRRRASGALQFSDQAR